MFSSYLTYQRVYNNSNMTGPLVKQELLTFPKHLTSSAVFLWRSCCSIFTFLCNVLYIVLPLIYGFWLLLWYLQIFPYTTQFYYDSRNMTYIIVGIWVHQGFIYKSLSSPTFFIFIFDYAIDSLGLSWLRFLNCVAFNWYLPLLPLIMKQ